MGKDFILKNKQWEFINQHHSKVGCIMMCDDKPDTKIKFKVCELLSIIIIFSELENSPKASTLEKDSLGVFCAQNKPALLAETNFEKEIPVGKEIYGLLGIALKLLR